MATFTPLNYDPLAGIAGQSSDVLNPAVNSLLSGDLPPFGVETEHPVSSATIAALTVVGLNASGNLVAADPGAGTPVLAIGILPYAVNSSMTSVSIWRTGCFNPNLLVWPAWYDSDAKKTAAFAGAPTPTQIVIRKPKTKTV